MDNHSIAKLLGEGTLPKEIVESLQEAFDAKVANARAEAETSVREEFSRRYEHDKSNLVEALDRMMTDVVTKHETEKSAAVQKFVEARNTFRKAIKESRRAYKSKLDESIGTSRKFVVAQLTGEISKLRESRKKLVADRLNTANKIESIKEGLARAHAARLKKIDEFVVRQVGAELKEFAVDHRALVETRLKLVKEGRKKLSETQSRFVKQAANKVEHVINTTLRSEMTQLHEDLEKNRQNMFGRRIFEAVAAEFMTSYLAEGTEIRKLQNVLESKKAELANAKSKLEEATRTSDVAQRKAKLAEDRAQRSKVLSELLSNLRGEKRRVMEGMLETTGTTALRETFNKLLPVVLDDSTRRGPVPAQQPRRSLNESARPTGKPATVLTGDSARANRVYESARTESADDFDEIAQVVRLAGIHK